MVQNPLYATVLLPLKFRDGLSYRIPEGMHPERGNWVEVPIGAKTSVGIVLEISDRHPLLEESRIREVSGLRSIPSVSDDEISFWFALADYYMCSPGEVFKAACTNSFIKQTQVKRPARLKKTTDGADASEAAAAFRAALPELSAAQSRALQEIRTYFGEKKPVLLHGVTGSGKTEIYSHLAADVLSRGRNVLYMVPEIAMSRQLEQRLTRYFGGRLLVFHSRQTAAQRKAVFDLLAAQPAGGPYVILGTRSAIFLPLQSPGLIIVDEEHDASYKQDDPAPRYNGRDAALLLALRCGAEVLLGSATPSLETLFNVECGKFRKVLLTEKFNPGAAEPDVVLIDTRKARFNRDMEGSFSKHLLSQMNDALERGGQILVFRSRRAYSTSVQCSQCGDIPLCPSCHIPLTYHKFKETLQCHYCGYSIRFRGRCKACGAEGSLIPEGAGTERIEEELGELFPSRRIERFDAETAASRTQEEKTLREFAEGKIDILVGTQMLTKGFDFEKLSLVAVIAADSLLAVQDFRADERALQLLRQFRGRAGRRSSPGRMFIQTSQPDHPVFRRLLSGEDPEQAERRAFGFPPYVRLIVITVRDRQEGRLWHACRELKAEIDACGIRECVGPIVPASEKIAGYHRSQFWIKMPRTAATAAIKRELYRRIRDLNTRLRGTLDVTIDVDPL